MLAIVTATTNVERARRCLTSWVERASQPLRLFIVVNGCTRPERVEIGTQPTLWLYAEDYQGSVPAFRKGVDAALAASAREPEPYDVIACFHDDLEIQEHGWDEKVQTYFQRVPQMGLAGFGGAIGLGAVDLYVTPYTPMQLARVGFRSNLVDAETHGLRSLLAERVVCLDGFSQIGRREFWLGHAYGSPFNTIRQVASDTLRPWSALQNLGFVHHFYDGALGCLVARAGWEAWYLPVRCRHYGGQTAVGDPGYQAWAKAQTPGGDFGFWEQAHQIGYEAFRDVLPLRV